MFSAGVQTYENKTVVTCGDESEKQGDNRAVIGERVSRKPSVAGVLCCKRSCCDKSRAGTQLSDRILSYMCQALALIPQSKRN